MSYVVLAEHFAYRGVSLNYEKEKGMKGSKKKRKGAKRSKRDGKEPNPTQPILFVVLFTPFGSLVIPLTESGINP